jgi:hypothetical protein
MFAEGREERGNASKLLITEELRPVHSLQDKLIGTGIRPQKNKK